MTASYRNPWHKPGEACYGPAEYTTDARPVAFAGCLIYERIRGVCWDVVRDGACLTQRAGFYGAREAATVHAPIGATIDTPDVLASLMIGPGRVARLCEGTPGGIDGGWFSMPVDVILRDVAATDVHPSPGANARRLRTDDVIAACGRASAGGKA